MDKDEFHKHFDPIFNKGYELQRIVWAYKKPKRDTPYSEPTETFSDIEKRLDDMQARIEDLRLDIYNLGDLRREFDCWLSYVIPRLRHLEHELVECRQFLQESELACLHRLSRLEFHLPI